MVWLRTINIMTSKVLTKILILFLIQSCNGFTKFYSNIESTDRRFLCQDTLHVRDQWNCKHNLSSHTFFPFHNRRDVKSRLTVWGNFHLYNSLHQEEKFGNGPSDPDVTVSPSAYNSEQTDKPSVALTGISISHESSLRPLSPSAIVDYLLSFFISDIGSIVLGLVGLFICLYNRLSSIDYDSSLLDNGAAGAMGTQSRTDLLAVIASGSVLLNGVSKLDITSASASSVILEGNRLENPILVQHNPLIVVDDVYRNSQSLKNVFWAMNSFLDSTETAVLLGHDGESWRPIILAGTVPPTIQWNSQRPTPILDKFFKTCKETYLPTFQALPGRDEFQGLLPSNAQATLLLAVPIHEHKPTGTHIVVVLASNTAKSLTPRDIAWCQVIANRLGKELQPFVT